MKLTNLLETLSPTGTHGLVLPRPLLGAFRRKSITFCTGVTDETSIVHWFQSRTFTIDYRAPDGPATPIMERQGWVGNSLWDEKAQQLSWEVSRSYQPRNQWPEPAAFRFMGNSVLEFAPSGAYVEDWRQQSSVGPLLGLRLTAMCNEATGQVVPMEGGFVLAGDHAAYACSRLPAIDDALLGVGDLQQALDQGLVTETEIESYEVSIAMDGEAITCSTRPERIGQAIAMDFEVERDGVIVSRQVVDGVEWLMRFMLDIYVAEFVFGRQTEATPEAAEWMRKEDNHLFRHAVVAR